MHAAGTATRIHAALVDAGLIAATVWILGALRTTVRRPAYVVADARTGGRLLVADDATLGVRAAWRRIARIDGRRRSNGGSYAGAIGRNGNE